MVEIFFNVGFIFLGNFIYIIIDAMLGVSKRISRIFPEDRVWRRRVALVCSVLVVVLILVVGEIFTGIPRWCIFLMIGLLTGVFSRVETNG